MLRTHAQGGGEPGVRTERSCAIALSGCVAADPQSLEGHGSTGTMTQLAPAEHLATCHGFFSSAVARRRRRVISVKNMASE